MRFNPLPFIVAALALSGAHARAESPEDAWDVYVQGELDFVHDGRAIGRCVATISFQGSPATGFQKLTFGFAKCHTVDRNRFEIRFFSMPLEGWEWKGGQAT